VYNIKCVKKNLTEAQMKGTLKAAVAGTAIATLAGCSSMVEIAERDTYAQPKWYAECASSGTEGYFWNTTEYAYACGAGESRYQQASEEQAYAFAMNNFAKRINGNINSQTYVEFDNDVRDTYTKVSYIVDDTRIRQHLEEERSTYVYAGKQYFFVKLKMPKDVFDGLVAENVRLQEIAKRGE
jgi:hypothetical protein